MFTFPQGTLAQQKLYEQVQNVYRELRYLQDKDPRALDEKIATAKAFFNDPDNFLVSDDENLQPPRPTRVKSTPNKAKKPTIRMPTMPRRYNDYDEGKSLMHDCV